MNGLKGLEPWQTYHKKLPLNHVPFAQPLQDRFTKKEETQQLEKEKWETQYVLLSRTINETEVVGKQKMNKYFKSMKPVNL